MRRSIFAVVALAFAALAGRALGATEPLAATQSWLAYGHDPQITNFVPAGSLRPVTAPLLTQGWTTQLDGAVVASPLYARGLLIVATEAGSIYALDGKNGDVVWQKSFGIVETPDDICGSY